VAASDADSAAWPTALFVRFPLKEETMSTAIATVKTIDYPALSPNSRQARIIAANLGGEPMSEMDLVRVKTPLGGATQWTLEVNGNIETTDEIVGLLVAIGRRGVLWPSEDPTELPPVLITTDLKVAYRVSQDLGSVSPEALERYRIGDGVYDWVSLSNSREFGFGSARGGSGKRVKESRVMAILREGETWPVLVSVGGGSLVNWLSFQKRLPCFPHEAVVGLKLAKVKSKAGQPYSQIVPRLVGTLTEEQGDVAKAIYADPLERMFSASPAGAASRPSGDE
jgi:hypothetical protein